MNSKVANYKLKNVNDQRANLNILFSSYGYVDGPGYQRTFKLALELAKLGHNVTYLTSQDISKKFPYQITIRDGVKEIAVYDNMPKKLKNLGLSIIAAVFKIYIIFKNEYDIIHADTGHRISSGIPCWFYKKIRGATYISEWWDYYGKGGQWEKKPLLWKLTYGILDNYLEVFDKKLADGVIALSTFTKSRAQINGIEQNRLTIVHGGADVKEIGYYSNHKFRSEYNIYANDFVIVLVGVADIEDFGPLFEYIPEISDEINLKIVTTGRKLDKTYVSKFNLQEMLIELGWIDYKDYQKVLSLADIFFLYQPNNNTNKAKWPNKIGDYLSAGRIIITNPINDVKKLTQYYSQSIITYNQETDNLGKILIEIGKNRRRIFDIGILNRQLAEKNTWSIKAKDVEEFYYKILNMKSAVKN